MPMFKSTQNIFKDVYNDEVFNENWMDSNKLILPNNKKWDYKKDLKIEDVGIWEIIYESGGGFGVYAAYDPYAEFYMIKPSWNLIELGFDIEIFYGKNAVDSLVERMIFFNVPFSLKKIWVENEDMWLYE
jgi:hypothetical protein